MPTDPTLFGYFGQWLWFAGEVAFKWIPSAAMAIALPQDPSLPHVTIPLFTQAVTVPQVSEYFGTIATPEAADAVFYWWTLYVALSIPFSLFFGAILLHSLIRIFRIRRIEYEFYQGHHPTVALEDVPATRLRFRHIEELVTRDDPQSWRIAILEADVMLGELLELQGYKGDTMADKLRVVDKSRFHTIDDAWAAHKVRNEIAHSSSHSPLEQLNIQETVHLYEKVFKEFGFLD